MLKEPGRLNRVLPRRRDGPFGVPRDRVSQRSGFPRVFRPVLQGGQGWEDVESVLFLLGHRAGGRVQHVQEWSPRVWVVTGQLELQAEQFLLGSLLETTRELGRRGGRAESRTRRPPPFGGRARRGGGRNRRKSRAPLEHTLCWGAGGRACQDAVCTGRHGSANRARPLQMQAVREQGG